MISGIIFTVAFAIMFVIMDGIAIKAKYWIKDPGHRIRAIMRAFVIFCIANMQHYTWFDTIKLWVFLCVVFWFVFDYGLNIYRGKAFLYVGKTALLDRFFGKYIHGFRLIALVMSYGVYQHLN